MVLERKNRNSAWSSKGRTGIVLGALKERTGTVLGTLKEEQEQYLVLDREEVARGG